MEVAWRAPYKVAHPIFEESDHQRKNPIGVEEQYYRSHLQVEGEATECSIRSGGQIVRSYDKTVRAAGRLKIERIAPDFTGADRLHAWKILIFIFEKSKDCYLAFLDLEKACGCSPRQVLWRALRKQNVPEHRISLVKDMYGGSSTTVRTSHDQTGATDVTIEVHQRPALSPFLFLLMMDLSEERRKRKARKSSRTSSRSGR
ncbi:hypothetical protein V3C99_016333 [Haemonchus contortus]|uniref:Transposase n=1 Tax=Haemonchus contortus TaxID=6289 RepID=A0A7I4Z0H2_HAECO